jgi:hypothetical protein
MTKYQTGIQKTVLEIIKKSKEMNLDYVTKKQIMDELIHIYGDFPNMESKVGQALYMLKKPMQHRKQEIKMVYDSDGKKLGYTIMEDKYSFDTV